jgi:hypothetical protein
VCADGIDHLAASAVIAEGLARPVPGGVRWLGDVLGSGGGTAGVDPVEAG